jgi:hypothetical protein
MPEFHLMELLSFLLQFADTGQQCNGDRYFQSEQHAFYQFFFKTGAGYEA